MQCDGKINKAYIFFSSILHRTTYLRGALRLRNQAKNLEFLFLHFLKHPVACLDMCVIGQKFLGQLSPSTTVPWTI